MGKTAVESGTESWKGQVDEICLEGVPPEHIHLHTCPRCKGKEGLWTKKA